MGGIVRVYIDIRRIARRACVNTKIYRNLLILFINYKLQLDCRTLKWSCAERQRRRKTCSTRRPITGRTDAPNMEPDP